jgi:hypothetical protein
MDFMHSTDANDEDCHFVWCHSDAFSVSTNQIGQSACGATAIVNACQALNIVVPPKLANEAIKTRLRNYHGSFLEFIKSRSNAGATHEDFAHCIDSLREQKVIPEDIVSEFYNYLELMEGKCPDFFLDFCLEQLRNNAALILTMNLQKDPVKVNMDGWVADAWHHQTVYGVDRRKGSFFLTNPLEMRELASLDCVLNSASELLIREEDIRKFVDPTQMSAEALQEIASDLDNIAPSWKAMGVGSSFLKLLSVEGGAVVDPSDTGMDTMQQRKYLTIPASYQPGVTVIRKVGGI